MFVVTLGGHKQSVRSKALKNKTLRQDARPTQTWRALLNILRLACALALNLSLLSSASLLPLPAHGLCPSSTLAGQKTSRRIDWCTWYETGAGGHLCIELWLVCDMHMQTLCVAFHQVLVWESMGSFTGRHWGQRCRCFDVLAEPQQHTV